MTVTRTVAGIDVPLAGEYDIDISHSAVEFVVRHLMVSRVRGRFNEFSGTITIGEDPHDSSVEVSVDLASVDTGDDQRDGHLRSPDFFDVEKYPTMTFTSTGLEWAGGSTGTLTGDLSLHGVTRPISLDFEYIGAVVDPMTQATKIGFTATGELDREDWGLTWNAALETGGWMVGKQVTIQIEVEAAKR